MKKIYFKGYYGYQNLGDDIFTVTAEWICNNYWKDYRPIFIGKNLPQPLSIKTKRLEIKNNLLRKLVELLICLRVQSIIYFGGSILSSGGNSFKDLKFYLRNLPILSKKVGTIGISIGPFDKTLDYNTTKEFLEKIKFISVRDYSSVEIANDMGLKKETSFSFDNAILIKDIYPELKKLENKKEKFKIAISLCRYERYIGKDTMKEREREKAIKQFINNIIAKNNNIEELVFIVFNGNATNGDKEITEHFNEYFSEKVNTRIVDYSSNTKKMLEEINNCDFMLGVRLHSGIVAYALEVPFMLVEYHPKCTEFLNTINHRYRFSIDNPTQTLNNFQSIINQKAVPEIENPEYFKRNMIAEINKIGSIL